MIKFTKAAVLGGAAAAIAVVTAASAFAAAPTFHITAGSKSSGTIAYTGKTGGSASKPGITFNDKTSGLSTTCNSGTASGSMKLGAKVSGTKAGSITKTTWTTCKAPGNVTLTPKQAGTWSLNGLARPSNGVTKVSISSVLAHVGTSIPGCKFDVTGIATGTYTNSTGKLAVNSATTGTRKLVAKNVGSCLGLVKNGDILQFKATYTVTTASGKIKIA
jgi:hypothetical protein